MEASVATPGQGAPAPAVQPGAPGQGQEGGGQPTAAGKGGFNWGNFPNVPEAQRELLEPHLRDIQGYITRMETQNAPYKGLMDYVQPGQVDQLLGFLNGYADDPLATWLGLAESLIQDKIMPDHVTAEALQGLLQQQQPQQGQASPAQDEPPSWAQELMQRMDAVDQEREQQQASTLEAENSQMLQTAMGEMRGQLEQAGIPPEVVSDPMLTAAIIAADGDIQAAMNSITSMRDGILKGFANGSGPRTPQVGNLPQPPPQAKGGRDKRNPFGGDVRNAARQRLEQSKAAEAQGS